MSGARGHHQDILDIFARPVHLVVRIPIDEKVLVLCEGVHAGCSGHQLSYLQPVGRTTQSNPGPQIIHTDHESRTWQSRHSTVQTTPHILDLIFANLIATVSINNTYHIAENDLHYISIDCLWGTGPLVRKRFVGVVSGHLRQHKSTCNSSTYPTILFMNSAYLNAFASWLVRESVEIIAITGVPDVHWHILGHICNVRIKMYNTITTTITNYPPQNLPVSLSQAQTSTRLVFPHAAG
jgi:hypothetical protein